MGGQNGINRKATLELHKHLGGLYRYKLRAILCGGLATNNRIAKMNDEEDGTCKCCSLGAQETTGHIFDDCPYHESKRANGTRLCRTTFTISHQATKILQERTYW